MTNEKNSVIMAPANPVQTVAPEKDLGGIGFIPIRCRFSPHDGVGYRLI